MKSKKTIKIEKRLEVQKVLELLVDERGYEIGEVSTEIDIHRNVLSGLKNRAEVYPASIDRCDKILDLLQKTYL